MGEEVLVLGAGFAGLNSALRLSRKGFDVKVLDTSDRHEFTPGVINVFRDRVPGEDLVRGVEEVLEGTGIEFVEEEVTGVDPGEGVVETGSGGYRYDHLVVALGSEPRTLGMDLSGAVAPYSLEAARKLDDELEAAESALVVGSGYVGIEVSTELEEKGLDVTVVDMSTRPMPNSNEKSSRLALEYLNDTGIDFKGGREVVEVSATGVETDSGRSMEADTVIWAGGVRASEVVRDSFGCGVPGIEVGEDLSHPDYENVFAAGDCADTGALNTAHNAIRQSEVIASNVGKQGGRKSFSEGTTPLVVSLGVTGIFIYGGRAYRSRFFRRLKDLIRRRYWLQLEKQRLKARFLARSV